MLHDQFSDKSFRVLYSKLQNYPSDIKPLIKSAEINYDEVESLPPTAFAWPERRKYAVHTKEHAVLSQIYSDGEKVPGYVSENIKKALDIYDVDVPQAEKVASAKAEDLEDYLVPHMRMGKLDSEENIKKAARFFSSNIKKMDMPTRVNAAVSLVKKAKKLDVTIPKRIYKHAGLTCTNKRVLTEWLEARKEAASKNDTLKTAYSKLASFVEKDQTELTNRKSLLKLADTIYDLDKKANLVPHYDRALPDPVLTVFNTSKLAEDTILLAGQDVPISTLMSVAKETYGDLLGDDIVPEITDADGRLDEANLLDILKTLPSDMQLALTKQLGM